MNIALLDQARLAHGDPVPTVLGIDWESRNAYYASFDVRATRAQVHLRNDGNEEEDEAACFYF